ncbi:MAG: hypothetical protein R3B09_04990 [Nannocystaceae bacterium]
MSSAIPRPTPPPDPRRRRRLARRTRTLCLAVTLAAVSATASALWSPEPSSTARLVASSAVVAAGVLVFEALLGRLRQRWQGSWRRALVAAGERFHQWALSLWPASPSAPEGEAQGLRPGERVALVAGCGLALLDVVLTTLLLRDVFPEPPYRFEFLEAISPAAVEWSFYLAVAAFKAILELWLGVFDGLRRQEGAGASPLRFFVLGLASAFDAALAVARGLLLAEQGITGAAVTTSNIVFVGFGLAVPWVVAHTGGLLVRAADPLLTRFGLLRALGALPRLILLGLLYGAAILVGLPIVIAVAAFGIAALLWSALDEMVAVLLGHDDPEAPEGAIAFEADAAADEGGERMNPGDAGRSALSILPTLPIGGGR